MTIDQYTPGNVLLHCILFTRRWKLTILENDIKNEDILKNEDDPKNQEGPNNGVNIKIKNHSK